MVLNVDLYQGDCLEIMDSLIDQGIKVDAVITDIPYFHVSHSMWDNWWKTPSDYLGWCAECISRFNTLLKADGSILLFTGRQYNRNICLLLDRFFDERRIIIWARKRTFNNTRGKALASGYEPICYYSRGNPVFNNIKVRSSSKRKEYTNGCLSNGVSLSDVWADIPSLPHNSIEKVKHSAQKPLKLMERCVQMVTKNGDTVLDFTMGSGTTGIACKKLGRNFIGIEINSEYFEIAKKRITETQEAGKWF